MKSVVPLLVAAHLHDLGKLKQACIDFIKANIAAVALSTPFIDLKTTHPLIWREVRAALGLTEEEDEEDEQQAKRARKS
jgi:hypothetical protein